MPLKRLVQGLKPRLRSKCCVGSESAPFLGRRVSQLPNSRRLQMPSLGSLGDGTGVAFRPPGRAIAGEIEYELLVAVGTVTASKMRREAQTRLTLLRSKDGRTEDKPVFLVSGAVGWADTLAGDAK